MANPVIAEILRQGRNKPRRYVLAALATGKVESGFRNLKYGDADSRGWRQERASLYRNPNNLHASVRRFYQEAAQHDHGQNAGRLAADVQRPAAQYRGRYAQAMPTAKSILAGRATGGSSGGGGGSRVQPQAQLSSTPNVAELLSTLGASDRPQPTITPPAAPSFSTTGPAVPEGAPMLDAATTPTVDQHPDYQGALEKLSSLQGGGLPDLSTLLRKAGGGAPSPGVNLSPHGGWAGTKGAVSAVRKLASDLTVSSAKRDRMSTSTGGVSDHWTGSKSSFANDLSGSQAQMDRDAVRIARALGVKGYRKGQPLVKTFKRDGIRWQLLYRTHIGGDHFNHIHVGARRL